MYSNKQKVFGALFCLECMWDQVSEDIIFLDLEEIFEIQGKMSAGFFFLFFWGGYTEVILTNYKIRNSHCMCRFTYINTYTTINHSIYHIWLIYNYCRLQSSNTWYNFDTHTQTIYIIALCGVCLRFSAHPSAPCGED